MNKALVLALVSTVGTLGTIAAPAQAQQHFPHGTPFQDLHQRTIWMDEAMFRGRELGSQIGGNMVIPGSGHIMRQGMEQFNNGQRYGTQRSVESQDRLYNQTVDFFQHNPYGVQHPSPYRYR